MSTRRELPVFAACLILLVTGFLAPCVFGGKILSPADVLATTESFRDSRSDGEPPCNRLLIDPVLQFQPWLAFNRAMLRSGRLPLWNSAAGCGAPFLANAQSAPFDPFHLIAYLGPLPGAYAWMAAARLWTAGFGMFLLARHWGLGPWGRWLAGLVYPFTGFLVVWLLFPVTAAAIWMPWMFLASDRVFESPSPRRVGLLGLVTGFLFLAGHIQTSAHVLLANGLYVAWLVWRRKELPTGPVIGWAIGIGTGLVLATMTIVPLWFYLGKSPVWAAREVERPSVLSLHAPRVLDAVCTAIPYAYGSQRRGHPNLARALGVHNLNESAGAFVGLTILLWLAPQAWLVRKESPRTSFLIGMAAVGWLGAFEFPPVVNVLRAIPILNVTDLRRLTLWAAFALPLLGGVGLDHLAVPWRSRAAGVYLSLGLVAAGLLAAGAALVTRSESWVRPKAVEHYARAAAGTEGADPAEYARRAERQVRDTLDFVPRILLGTSSVLATLVVLAVAAHRTPGAFRWVRPSLVGLTLYELAAFGYGLNPMISRDHDLPMTPVVQRLLERVGREGRILGVGAEFPPNVAMRYGLADVRNYDSVELSRSLDWFAPLYEPSREAPSSRRTITWAGVVRARERLREAGVRAVVAASPPPEDLQAEAEQVGGAWIAWLDAAPIVGAASAAETRFSMQDGRISAVVKTQEENELIIRETFDQGWRATVDGRPAEVRTYAGVFMAVSTPRGASRVDLIYDPPEARVALVASLAALATIVFALTNFRPIRST